MAYVTTEKPYEKNFGVDNLLGRFPSLQDHLTKGMGKVGSDESLPYQVLNVITNRYIEALHKDYKLEGGGPFVPDEDGSNVARFAALVEQSRVEILLLAAEMTYKPNFKGLGGVEFPRNVRVSGQEEHAVNTIYSVLDKIVEDSSLEELLSTTLANQARYGQFDD